MFFSHNYKFFIQDFDQVMTEILLLQAIPVLVKRSVLLFASQLLLT
jgi:hypothetical protein